MTSLAGRGLADRRRQGSLGGLLVGALGAGMLTASLSGDRAGYLYLALGAAFAIAYVQSRRTFAYLLGACTLIALGSGLLLHEALALPQTTAGVAFLGVLALGPFIAFAIDRTHRWPLGVTAVLGVIATVEALGIALVPQAAQQFVVPGTLIAMGWCLARGARADTMPVSSPDRATSSDSGLARQATLTMREG